MKFQDMYNVGNVKPASSCTCQASMEVSRELDASSLALLHARLRAG